MADNVTYGTIVDRISAIVLERRLCPGWLMALGGALLLLLLGAAAVAHLLITGIGIWGINIPVAWGFAIIHFVWWIGIGHAGTLISAILLLMRQPWRTSINRFAEAMTIFAVMCAALFPLLHLGRPKFFYWLLPYPNTFVVQPQFRSPLVWDAFAVGTYFTVSLLFWYLGMIPDLAVLRDRARRWWVKAVYGFFAMGWRGSALHWHRHEVANVLLAGLATPLVVSVHSVVSLDFAVAQLPGWHSTIFPPYFVAGAIYSGFAMVMAIAIPLRAAYRLEEFITVRHLDNMAKVMLATGLLVGYGYLMENFIAWYSRSPYERFGAYNRFFGPYGWAYHIMLLCNVGLVQLLWWRRIRTSVSWLMFLSLVVLVGMWFERYVIVITSLHRDFLPSSWDMYYPTVWDWLTFIGSIGLFLIMMTLFIRLLPMISIFEMQRLAERERAP